MQPSVSLRSRGLEDGSDRCWRVEVRWGLKPLTSPGQARLVKLVTWKFGIQCNVVIATFNSTVIISLTSVLWLFVPVQYHNDHFIGKKLNLSKTILPPPCCLASLDFVWKSLFSDLWCSLKFQAKICMLPFCCCWKSGCYGKFGWNQGCHKTLASWAFTWETLTLTLYKPKT